MFWTCRNTPEFSYRSTNSLKLVTLAYKLPSFILQGLICSRFSGKSGRHTQKVSPGTGCEIYCLKMLKISRTGSRYFYNMFQSISKQFYVFSYFEWYGCWVLAGCCSISYSIFNSFTVFIFNFHVLYIIFFLTKITFQLFFFNFLVDWK